MLKKKLLLELRNSLRRRGFWVDVVDKELVLDVWYSKSNFIEMVSLLTALQIGVSIGEQGIRLKPNTLVSDALFQQIEFFHRQGWNRFSVSRPQEVPAAWNHNPDNDLSILDLDSGIASLVFALNKVGLYTSMSCDGHGQREPNIWLRRQDYAETIQNILMEANQQVSFAYDWEIKKGYRNIVLTAKRRLSIDKWDVEKIQDDALALSEYIYKNYSASTGKKLSRYNRVSKE